jgi:hypothetical protein
MVKCILIFICIIICQLEAQSQTSIDVVKDKLALELKNAIKDSAWTIEVSKNVIELKFIEIFFENTSISPINNRTGFYNKLDTLYIRIRFEENWSTSRMDSLARNNRAVLEPLIKKYITFYDSLKWKNMKSSRGLFMEKPYTDLKHWRGLNESEKKSFLTVARLPNQVIDNIGIFADSDYKLRTMLEPEAIMDRVLIAHTEFWKIINKGSLSKYEGKY